MHDGLQPVSLLQKAANRDPDDTAGPLLTAQKPVAALPVQALREAAHLARPGHGTGRGAQPAGLTEPAGQTEATGLSEATEVTEPVGERAPAGPDVPAPAAPVVASAPGPAQPDDPARPVTAEDLNDEQLLRPHRAAPTRGWRRVVFQASFGLVNPGESPAELRYQALVARAQAPVTGCRRIAVVSAKGGVGKTSTTLGLGATAAGVRGDRVVAVDANPDLGTLGERVRRDNQATVRDLLRAAGRLERYPDVRAFTSQTPARLEVLAADCDPALSEAFDEAHYRQACDLLGRFYNLLVTDLDPTVRPDPGTTRNRLNPVHRREAKPRPEVEEPDRPADHPRPTANQNHQAPSRPIKNRRGGSRLSMRHRHDKQAATTPD